MLEHQGGGRTRGAVYRGSLGVAGRRLGEEVMVRSAVSGLRVDPDSIGSSIRSLGRHGS